MEANEKKRKRRKSETRKRTEKDSEIKWGLTQITKRAASRIRC